MPWTAGSGCCGIVSRRLVGDASTQTALLSVEQRPARRLRNTAHQFLAGQVNSEGLNKSHEGQPSGTSGFDPNHELDCPVPRLDRKSTRLNSSHLGISYAVFCLKKK